MTTHISSTCTLILLLATPVFGDVFTAIKSGQTDKVIEMCNNDANILTHRDPRFGAQPLTWACLNNNLDLARFFIENGASIEDRNSNDDTPLLIAAAKGNKEIVQLLLENGADINARNKTASTPLAVAIYYRHADTALLLLNNNASISATNNAGQTPLHIASLAGIPDVAAKLVSLGANADAMDIHGYTPLMSAAAIGSAPIVRLLITAGADPDLKAPDGSSARRLAESEKRHAVLTVLNSAQRGAAGGARGENREGWKRRRTSSSLGKNEYY